MIRGILLSVVLFLISDCGAQPRRVAELLDGDTLVLEVRTLPLRQPIRRFEIRGGTAGQVAIFDLDVPPPTQPFVAGSLSSQLIGTLPLTDSLALAIDHLLDLYRIRGSARPDCEILCFIAERSISGADYFDASTSDVEAFLEKIESRTDEEISKFCSEMSPSAIRSIVTLKQLERLARQKAAQPGATDNPDDAQRLRENH